MFIPSLLLLMAAVDAADPVPIIVALVAILLAELPLRKPAVAGVCLVEFLDAVVGRALEGGAVDSVAVVFSVSRDSFT